MSLARLAAGVAALMLAATNVGAAPSAFEIEPIKSVTPYELWHSTLHPFIGDGVSLQLYQFDPEDAAQRNGKKVCGIVLGGNGDLASTPVAVRLWSRSGCTIDAKKSGPSKRDGGSMSLTLMENSRKETIEFRINADGKMLVNEKIIGSVQ